MRSIRGASAPGRGRPARFAACAGLAVLALVAGTLLTPAASAKTRTTTAALATKTTTKTASTAATKTITLKGVTYTYDAAHLAAGATATGYSGDATSITLPTAITVGQRSIAVTQIASRAFAGHRLQGVTLGKAVATIGASAFGSNPDLQLMNLTGPAPKVTPAGAKDQAGHPTESFDTTAPNFRVRFSQLYKKSWLYPHGFTTTWQGYQTFSPPQTSWCDPDRFTDVGSGNMFCDDISWLALQRVTKGFPDGAFRPTATVSRENMAMFLYRFAHAQQRTTNGDVATPSCSAAPMPDVPTSSPSCGAIRWLAAQHITHAYPDGNFRPRSEVTRQQMAAFLFRMAAADQSPPSCAPSKFSDVGSANQFCGAITWLVDNQITTLRSDGSFGPRAPVTRQQLAAFLHRVNENVTRS